MPLSFPCTAGSVFTYSMNIFLQDTNSWNLKTSRSYKPRMSKSGKYRFFSVLLRKVLPPTTWKVSIFAVFLIYTFPNSGWIRRFTLWNSLFCFPWWTNNFEMLTIFIDIIIKIFAWNHNVRVCFWILKSKFRT